MPQRYVFGVCLLLLFTPQHPSAIRPPRLISSQIISLTSHLLGLDSLSRHSASGITSSASSSHEVDDIALIYPRRQHLGSAVWMLFYQVSHLTLASSDLHHFFTNSSSLPLRQLSIIIFATLVIASDLAWRTAGYNVWGSRYNSGTSLSRSNVCPPDKLAFPLPYTDSSFSGASGATRWPHAAPAPLTPLSAIICFTLTVRHLHTFHPFPVKSTTLTRPASVLRHRSHGWRAQQGPLLLCHRQRFPQALHCRAVHEPVVLRAQRRITQLAVSYFSEHRQISLLPTSSCECGLSSPHQRHLVADVFCCLPKRNFLGNGLMSAQLHVR